MNPVGLAYERYRVGPFDEWMMRIGAADAPPVLFVPPLFEEMNRTRALIAAMMRALAVRGFGCWLPDLPGTGESERALEAVSWDDWRHGVTQATVAAGSGRPLLVASLRGGALLDDAAEGAGYWRLSPADGASLVRDMERSGLAGGADWAGYAPSAGLRTKLAEVKPGPVSPLRVVRLESDRGEADAKLEGPALWRRSEPGTSPSLAGAAAADLEEWARTCGVC